MTVVDTSYLIALSDATDLFHDQASAKPRHGDRFLVPWEIWLEFCQVLMRTQPEHHIREATARLRRGPFHIDRVLDEDDLSQIAATSARAQKAVQSMGHRPLTVFDLVVLTIAARFKENVYTFDQSMIAAIRQGLFPGARLG
jgi:predicted nucleic acid-binding protein